MDAEKVSVIIPVHNAEQFLRRAAGSVLDQSYRELDVVLVDDGSTDTSPSICEELAHTDNRIRVVTRNNGGPAAARNTGLHHATGGFVFFLDADDYIERETIRTLVETYQRHDPDLVMCNFRKLDHGEIVPQGVTFRPGDSPFHEQVKVLSAEDSAGFVRHFLRHPSNHMISYCWGRLYKKSIIDEYEIRADENMRMFEDFVFNLDYLRHVAKSVFVNDCLYTYAMHTAHVSASMTIMNTDSLLHDMDVFRRKATDYFREIDGGATDTAAIEGEIGHALVHYVIIFMIRTCRQLTGENGWRIYREVRKMVRDPFFRDCLRHYVPAEENSRIVPFLMRIRTTCLLMLYCRHRSFSRYGRPGPARQCQSES